jgi:tRNA dimethylallyltransferase
MVERGKAATRQLAKRQITWLRSEPACHWLYDADDVADTAAALTRQWLAKTSGDQLTA